MMMGADGGDHDTGNDDYDALHNGKMLIQSYFCDITNDMKYSVFLQDFTNKYFSSYPNSRLDTTSDVPISNVWPEDCAFLCIYSTFTCRSFNYYRSGRQCVLLATDMDSAGNVGLVPEFEDPWDYYHRGQNLKRLVDQWFMYLGKYLLLKFTKLNYREIRHKTWTCCKIYEKDKHRHSNKQTN